MHTGREACRVDAQPGHHHCRLGAGCAGPRVRARGQRVHGRRALAVAARRAGPHRRRGRDRAPSRAACTDTGGVYVVPAFTGLGAPVLGRRGARRHLRAHARRAAGPTSCAPRWSRWPTRCTTWPWPWRPTRAMPHQACSTWTAARRRTISLMQFQSDLLRTPLHRPAEYGDDGARRSVPGRLGNGFLEGHRPACATCARSDDGLRAGHGGRAAMPSLLEGWARAVRRTMAP